jgi:hypothetical protein
MIWLRTVPINTATPYAGIYEKSEDRIGRGILRKALWRTAKAWVFVDGQIAASTVWREALAIIQRYPSATVVPAVVLTAIADIPYYFIEASGLAWEQLITFLTAAFAFYLYVAYAEEVVVEAEREVNRITMRGVLHELRQATPVVPPVVVASVAAVAIPSAATGLLVLPGLWLLTRWSLFAPVISRERLGPVAALKRSNQLVRDHFWVVVLTATLAFILEEALIHAGALVGHLVSGSDTWGEWLGSSIAASLITPLAALTTSVAYGRLANRVEPLDDV